jgi:hypothetical protein
MNAHDWTPADVVLILTAITTMLVAIIGAVKGTQAKDAADRNGEKIDDTRRAVNGQMTAAVTAARAEGYLRGLYTPVPAEPFGPHDPLPGHVPQPDPLNVEGDPT